MCSHICSTFICMSVWVWWIHVCSLCMFIIYLHIYTYICVLRICVCLCMCAVCVRCSHVCVVCMCDVCGAWMHMMYMCGVYMFIVLLREVYAFVWYMHKYDLCLLIVYACVSCVFQSGIWMCVVCAETKEGGSVSSPTALTNELSLELDLTAVLGLFVCLGYKEIPAILLLPLFATLHLQV